MGFIVRLTSLTSFLTSVAPNDIISSRKILQYHVGEKNIYTEVIRGSRLLFGFWGQVPDDEAVERLITCKMPRKNFLGVFPFLTLNVNLSLA